MADSQLLFHDKRGIVKCCFASKEVFVGAATLSVAKSLTKINEILQFPKKTGQAVPPSG